MPSPSGQCLGTASDGGELNVANAVGELLALGPTLAQAPSAVYFKDNLRRCIDQFAGGNHSHFARITGVPLDSLYRWLTDNTCIRLDSFLRMSCKLRLSAARFLSEYIPLNDPDWERARDMAQGSSSRGPRRRPDSQRRDPGSATNTDASTPFRTGDSIRDGFVRALREPTPRSLHTVARSLGFNNCSSLYHRFPDLCRDLVIKKRHWRQQEDERIREAMTKGLEETPAPSMKELAVRLGHTVRALRARFPALSAALAAHIPERRLFEKERLRGRLQAALELNPAPPLKDVARYLGRGRRGQSYLGVLFPDLCQQIRDRYVQGKKRKSSEKRLLFCAEIRSTVTDLCERGINPSRKHVIAAIVNPSMLSTHILDQQIAQTLRELEAASRISFGSSASG